jgi:hypothetical protein
MNDVFVVLLGARIIVGKQWPFPMTTSHSCNQLARHSDRKEIHTYTIDHWWDKPCQHWGQPLDNLRQA